MSTLTATPLGAKPTRNTINLNIRTLDNGYLLGVNKDTKDGYESIELALTSLPKLLKAVGTFLKENQSSKEEGE